MSDGSSDIPAPEAAAALAVTQLEFSGDRIAVLPSERYHVLNEESCRVFGMEPVLGHTFHEDSTKCGVTPMRVVETLVPLGMPQR